MNNLFGFGPKALFWLRMGSYVCQTSVFGSIFVDLATLPYGKTILGVVGAAGLFCTSVATGTPPTKV